MGLFLEDLIILLLFNYYFYFQKLHFFLEKKETKADLLPSSFIFRQNSNFHKIGSLYLLLSLLSEESEKRKKKDYIVSP